MKDSSSITYIPTPLKLQNNAVRISLLYQQGRFFLLQHFIKLQNLEQPLLQKGHAASWLHCVFNVYIPRMHVATVEKKTSF